MSLSLLQQTLRQGGTVGKECKKFNQKDAGNTVCWYKAGATQQNHS